MHLRFTGLWRQPYFMRLWVGQTISVLGSSLTVLALPLTAVLLLNSSALQMGILAAAGYAPFLLVSLFAGVVVDRSKRRPILIIADLGRAVLLLCIPIAVWFNFLRIEYLYVIALLVSTLTVFFDIAYYSYLPTLIGREQLIEANSKLEISEALAQIAGPGLAGGLFQLIAAPLAIVIDAFSFLVSVFSLVLIRAPEQGPVQMGPPQKMRSEIGEGIRLVGKNPLLRAIMTCGTMHNFVNSMLSTILILYLTRYLAIQPVVIGGIFVAGNCGALVGALLGNRISSLFGVGPMLIGAQLLTGIAVLCYLLTSNIPTMKILLLVIGQILWGISRTIFHINQMSLRQIITPNHLLGRVNATIRFISWGAMVPGSFLGGFLGEMMGLPFVLGIVAIGELLAALWVFVSPIRVVREPAMFSGELPHS